MILKILLLILLIASPCFAQEWQEARMNVAIVGGGVPAGPSCGGGTSYLLCENFDGTSVCGDGSHTNCNTTWTSYGAGPVFDFNYTTSPAPLEGTYSAHTESTEVNSGFYANFAAQDTAYFFFMINAHARATGSVIFKLTDGTSNLFVFDNSGPEFSIYCGTVLGYSTAMALDTTYYVWGDYTKGTGSNAICHLFHATTSTKPAANITITNGTATTQASRAYMNQAATTNDVYVIDKIRVSSSDIGSNPN